ncbi:MAG: GatB/YqeY domain-containing protein [Actinomycetota bacterium]
MTEGSDLKQRLAEEMKDALKAGQKVRLSALRLLAASVKNREVELLHTLSDEELQEVALREVKHRNEAIEAYQAAGRQELVDREREEREVLQPYIPAQLSDAEVDAIVDEALAATGAASPQEMGKVMGFVMGRAKGKVDGSVVQAKVRSRLGA